MLLDIIINLVLLVASISALVFVAEKLINHSIKLASILGVSGAVVGLTLLAYGTTIPEFTISVLSSVGAHDQLSVSNIIGTNIYNIAMVIGLVAIISPFAWKEDLRLEGLLMAAGAFGLIPLASRGGISSLLGAMMALLIVGYTYYVLKMERERRPRKAKKAKGSAKKEFLWCCLLLGGVILAANFTVDFAVQLSRYAGISEWIIGSTIVAAGTSVPETVVSIMAARKRQMACPWET